jgi:parallel beta-helix repeat protein
MKQKKELLSVIFCMLLFATSYSVAGKMNNYEPLIEKQTESKYGYYLFVGGNGSGNFSTIQDAIDNANDGDTVFVFDESSPYYENIVINKSIDLIGENKDTTVIDGRGYKWTVFVLSEKVLVTGFTIQNATREDIGAGIYIYENINYIEIISNQIMNNRYGIYIYESGWHKPKSQYGYLGAFYNIIYRNSISNNSIGIRLVYSCYNIIQSNSIEQNELRPCLSSIFKPISFCSILLLCMIL